MEEREKRERKRKTKADDVVKGVELANKMSDDLSAAKNSPNEFKDSPAGRSVSMISEDR